MDDDSSPRTCTHFDRLNALVRGGTLAKSRLSATALKVYLCYLSHSDKDGMAFPSNQLLMDECGVTDERTISAARKALVSAKIMELFKARSRYDSPVYKLLRPPIDTEALKNRDSEKQRLCGGAVRPPIDTEALKNRDSEKQRLCGGAVRPPMAARSDPPWPCARNDKGTIEGTIEGTIAEKGVGQMSLQDQAILGVNPKPWMKPHPRCMANWGIWMQARLDECRNGKFPAAIAHAALQELETIHRQHGIEAVADSINQSMGHKAIYLHPDYKNGKAIPGHGNAGRLPLKEGVWNG